MQCQTGSYVGTGVPHGITWSTAPFFTPDLVVVKADDTQYAVFRTSAMPAFKTTAFAFEGSLFSDAIRVLIANGFQVGTHVTVNANGVTYYWAAFYDNGAGDFNVGSYTGDGTDGRNLDIVGFQPTILWIKAREAGYHTHSAVWRVAELIGDETLHFKCFPNTNNLIQDLRPLGFQVGDSLYVNEINDEYDYVAFRDVAGLVETGDYAGNGIDDRAINVGFEPSLIFVKGEDYECPYLRIDTMPVGRSGGFHPEALALDKIQAFAANVFQVGTSADVNFPDVNYYWAAWRAGSSYASTTTTSTLSTTSTSTLSTTSTTSTSTLSTTLTTTTLPFTPVPGTNPILRICDKDGCINLLKRKKQSGYRLCGWTPRIADYKRGGIWQDSPIAEGRRLAQRRFGNVAETMNLAMSGHRLETLIRESQDLRRLMEKASNYWWANWQNDPIWLEARAKCETNARYAILHRGKILVDNSPYEQPFMERLYGRTAARNLNLILERGHWMSLPPERSASVLASAWECYEWPYHLEFDGKASSMASVNCGNDAALNDLHDEAMTIEAWIRADGWGVGDQGRIVDKNMWQFRIEPVQGLRAIIICAVTAGSSASGDDDFTIDGEWHHVAMTWDDATYNYPRLWIDGVEPGYSTTQNRNGAIVSDAANDLRIGNRSVGGFNFDGGIGWVRVSNVVRYASTFTPPERCRLPDIDTDVVAQWIGVESSGTTIDNQEGTPGRDGTQTDCLFDVDCERCYGNVDSESCYPHYLEFNGVTSITNCGSDAGLDDIPSGGAITVDGWVKSYSTQANHRVIIQKSHADLFWGWTFYVHATAGLAGRINYTPTDAHSYSGTDEFDPTDGVWHHILLTYNEAGVAARTIYLAIDGVWVSSYSSQVASVGAYDIDNDRDLLIGNNGDNARSFDGDIGWMRVSDNVRYAINVNFTPPSRCTLPAIDANVLGQWIGEEPPGATIINQEGTDTRNGAQTSCTFACDCSEAADGELHPVADHIYVANKCNEANITHIFRYDASLVAYSANLVGTVPYNLLSVVPAAGDIVYLGIATTAPDSGPFSSLVFDLEDAHADITGIVWEYWDGGAWSTLTIEKDNTENWFHVSLGRLSINSIVWGQPSDWATTAVNLVSGYWVRARVISVGGAPTPPRQQNRDIYTVVWPYLEVDGDDIGGDIVALALFKQVSAGFEIDDIVVGLRSLGRGSDFSAYLNCADEQNPTGVSVAVSGNCAFGDTLSTGSGREVLYTAGADGAIEIGLDASVCNQYYGVFHAYLRGLQDGGYEGDTVFSISVELGTGRVVQEQLTGFEFEPDTDWFLVDIGRLEMSPPTLLDSSESYDENRIIVDVSGAQDVHFYNLVLIPIDEWVAKFTDLEQGASSTNRLEPGRLLEFESTRHPKQSLRANLWNRRNQRIVGHWDKQANGPAILQANASQRLWVLASLGNVSRPEILTWFSVEAVQRYLSMRGDR